MVRALPAGGCAVTVFLCSVAASPVPAAVGPLQDATARLDLSAAGLEATIEAPAGAVAEESFGTIEVTAGDTSSIDAIRSGDVFYLEIHSGHADLESRRAEIAGNSSNQLAEFLVDSDTELVYRTEVMRRSEHHFVANVTVGEAAYHCEDSKGPFYTLEAIERMRRACHSLAAR